MYIHTTRINTKKELRQNSGKEAPMARIIFHIDVNSAFLSWTAVEQLKNGSKVDLREIPAIIGGDQMESSLQNHHLPNPMGFRRVNL